MKKYLIALLAILILFVGCENGLRTGTLTINININQSTAKTVMPDTAKTAIAKYVVQGFCGSNTFKQEFSSSSFSISLDEGQWSINIDAYGSDDKLVAKSDSQTVQIVGYKDASATFLLKPIFDGTGVFSFKLGIPYDATAMNKVLCSLTSEDGSLAEVNFEFDFSTEGTVDGDYKIFTKTLSIPAGSYNLKVETTNLLGDVYGIPINDSVIIQAEQETSFEHIWDLVYFPRGVSLNINNGGEYYLGYIYIKPSSENAKVYLSLDAGSFTDITSKISSDNKYTITGSTWTSCRLFASVDITKWSREGTKSCYELNHYGPAGGYVFYDCDADNTVDDANGSDNLKSDVCGWRYLEAAPKDASYINASKILKDAYYFGYYRINDVNTEVGTKTNIGTGKENTEALVNAMGETAYLLSDAYGKGEYAAKACADYSINGYDDWFLPSLKELYLMYENLSTNGEGNFSYSYWSSSEGGSIYAYSLVFSTGKEYSSRDSNNYVRPVRAF